MELELKIKHRLIVQNRARYYYLNLSERNFDMEKTTPRSLILPNAEIKINETSWVHMIIELVNYLQSKNPKQESELLSFKVTWSDKLVIFSHEKENANFYDTNFGYWLNCNMTSIHFLWFISELLDFYGLDKRETVLIYHRTPKVEPLEIQEAVEKETKIEIRRFLCKNYNFSIDRSEKIIKNMMTLNKFLKTTSSGYNNLFLFDSSLTFASQKTKIMDALKSSPYASSIKNIDLAQKYLDYLTAYFQNSGYSRSNIRDKNGLVTIPNMYNSKYSCIEKYFSQRTEDFIFLSFEQLEDLLNIKLPPTAYKKSSYWDEKYHTLPRHFITGGYEIEVNVNKQLIYLFKIKE